MSSVSIKNNTSHNFSFEARVLTLQGQHVTVRAMLPATRTTDVTLPNGITPEMLAQSPEVAAEQARTSPRWSVVGVSSDSVEGLSDYEVFREVQPVPGDLVEFPLGCASRNMRLAKLRVCSAGPSAAGESYEITQLFVNGVNVLPATQTCLLDQNTPAYTKAERLLSGSWTDIKEGDFIAIGTVYVGAASMLATSVELVGSKC